MTDALPLVETDSAAVDPKTPRRSRLKLWLFLSIPLTLFAGAAAYGFSYYEINQTLSKLKEIGGQYTAESSLDDRPEWVKEKFLPGFDRITHLYATGEEFDSAMLRSICKHAELEELTLNETSVTDAGLSALSDQTGLLRLKIIDHEGGLIHALPEWDDEPKLRSIELLVQTPNSTFGRRLATCRNLERLKFCSMNTPDRIDIDLSPLTQLVSLTVGEESWDSVEWSGSFPYPKSAVHRASGETSRAMMEMFSSLPSVDYLRVLRLDLANWDGIKDWASTDSIERCDCTVSKIDRVFIGGLAKCHRLEVLSLDSSGETEDVLSQLSALRFLRKLAISSPDPFSADFIAGLPKLRGIQELRLSNEWSSGEVFEQLHSMPKLRSLDLMLGALELSDISALANVSQLEQIDCTHLNLVDDQYPVNLESDELVYIQSEDEIDAVFRSVGLVHVQVIHDTELEQYSSKFTWEDGESLDFFLPKPRAGCGFF